LVKERSKHDEGDYEGISVYRRAFTSITKHH
jgi:hypothetical protein